LALVLATTVFVAGLANLVAFKEQDLGTALPCVNLGWQGGGIAKFEGHIAFPFGLEGCDVHNNPASGISAFTQANGEHIAGNTEIFQGACQSKAIRRNDANVGMDVDKAFFIEILGVDHGAVNVGEHLELRRAADVVAITAGAVADDFLACRVLADLAWLERLDHAVLLRHTADPFVAFNRHLFVFPTMLRNIVKKARNSA